MNRFELFTLIYFWLDSYYEDATDDRLITQISDMNPFIWEDIGSADPVAYIDFCEFIGDKEITVDNSLEIAKEYVKTIDYADVTPAFDDLTDEDIERWKDGCEEYLSSDHKGAGAQSAEKTGLSQS
jgi:hypothetical protein